MKLLFLPALLIALAAPAPRPVPVDVVGNPVPESELEDFANTEAEAIDDFLGRTVLFEFFAYW